MTTHRSNNEAYRLGTSQAVSYDGSAAVSNAFGAQTTEIRVATTTSCWMAFGESASAPTAAADTANNHYLPANFPQVFRCTPGQKVAFIKATGGSAGVACVTELTR